MVWTVSGEPLPRYEVSHEDGAEMCEVVMYLGMRYDGEASGESGVYWAERKRLVVRWEDGLMEDIRSRYWAWMELAEKEGE